MFIRAGSSEYFCRFDGTKFTSVLVKGEREFVKCCIAGERRRRNSVDPFLGSFKVCAVIAVFWTRFQRRALFARARTTILPLPGGEGRGEGECFSDLPMTSKTGSLRERELQSDKCSGSPST